MSAAPRGLVLIAAGGTGGHLFPAQALAERLGAQGFSVALATDARGARFQSSFAPGMVHEIPAATIWGRNPFRLAGALVKLARGVFAARRVIARLAPSVVVGFGGYPTVPPLVAAWSRGVPSLLHEQNAVMGRANRFLAGFADAVAVSFPDVAKLPGGARGKVHVTGIPVRGAAVKARRAYRKAAKTGAFNLLVFGGSQGALVFSEVVPAAVAQLPAPARKRLKLVQQARAEDIAAVRAAYKKLGVAATVEPFFSDLPARMAAAHLIVSRSGASTCAEVATIGRPAILVPLPGAIDADQLMNARALEAAKAGLLLPQSGFTPARLADELARFMDAPDELAAMAKRAGALGSGDAVERLAALVRTLAGNGRGTKT